MFGIVSSVIKDYFGIAWDNQILNDLLTSSPGVESLLLQAEIFVLSRNLQSSREWDKSYSFLCRKESKYCMRSQGISNPFENNPISP